MTITTSRPSTEVAVAKGDVRTIQYNRAWTHFRHLQQGFENTGIRLFYYDGTIEILMPGKAHELFKKIIAILIEQFLISQRVEFKPTGSVTREKEGVASSEPDESYEIQGLTMVVEVNFTSGDTSKLKRYQALGVDEVWIWEDGILEVYNLNSAGYQKVERSMIPAFAQLDIQLMSQCILIGETSRLEATDKLLGAR